MITAIRKHDYGVSIWEMWPKLLGAYYPSSNPGFTPKLYNAAVHASTSIDSFQLHNHSANCVLG